MAINDYLRTSSLDVVGNLNFRSLKEKKRYNDWLLGDATRIDLGHDEDDGNTNSTPPEWVQSRVGSSQAFVIQPLSASHHEVSVLNAYNSGTVELESTAIPASGTQYYSKQTRFITKMYSLTASVDLSGTDDGRIGELVAGRGNWFQGANSTPARFKINVPEYGKLQNIRVWVELENALTPYQRSLDNLKHALISPNVTGFLSCAWMNDASTAARVKEVGYDYYKNSFLLFDTTQTANSWAQDHGIRVIYDDAASHRNNRHADLMHENGGDKELSFGPGGPAYEFTGSLDIGNDGDLRNGNGIHWTSEVGLVRDTAVSTSASSQSPPEGWLTGPGGAAGPGEYPTTGSNWGPAIMQPFYPLLDTIEEHAGISPGANDPTRTAEYVGTRPGLYGTEIHGEWTLICSPAETSLNYNDFAYFRQFRLEITYSVNSEPTIRRPTRHTVRSKQGEVSHRHYISGTFGTLLNSMFGVRPGGAAERMNALSRVTTTSPVQMGLTVGITADTGSSPNYAVFSRVTGSLADRLSASLGFQHAFLSNEFGTPYIPLSSGSGEAPAFDTFADVKENKRIVAETLSPNPLVTKATTMNSALTKFATTKKTRDLIDDAVSKISGSA